VVVTVGAVGAFFVRGPRAGGYIGRLSAIDWACAVVIVGCLQTIVVRLSKIFGELRARPEGGAS
jgi:hypothetical protein